MSLWQLDWIFAMRRTFLCAAQALAATVISTLAIEEVDYVDIS